MQRMRLIPALLCLCTLMTAGTALAQTQLKTKPYDAIQATYDRSGENDPALKARIATLRQAVSDHTLAPIEAMLSSGYAALSCTIDPLAPCAPGAAKVIGKPQLKPAERLRVAICCEGDVPLDVSKQDQDETVIGFFATVLEENSVSAHPDFPGTACLPGLAKFDRTKAAKAVKAAGIDPENLRVAGADIQLREKPAEDAPVVQEVKPGDLLPLVVELTMSIPAGWNSIAMPKGGLGFTDQVGINELTPPAVCFLKLPNGEWQIAFTIQRGG
ncbi:MAG: hypothetical protein QOF41_909 [Methylobacteriaceae bacterium]|nr:hypothetical protein [Methylobacteriaceae bacterium]